MVSGEETGAGPLCPCAGKAQPREGRTADLERGSLRGRGRWEWLWAEKRASWQAGPLSCLSARDGTWTFGATVSGVCSRDCGDGDSSWPVTAVCSGEVTSGQTADVGTRAAIRVMRRGGPCRK